MIIIREVSSYEPQSGTAVTIGKFDGLHRGHRELISRTVKRAREDNLEAAVFSISIASESLLTRRERTRMISEMGADKLIEADISSEFLSTSAESFIRDTLCGRLRARYVVIGEDFHFGRGRAGDAAMLEREGRRLGFDVEVVPFLGDAEGKISSSRVREALSRGDMECVGELLGYPYFVTGVIVHGRQLGRTIGVPTANLITEKNKLLPPYGVYYTRSEVWDRQYLGVTNVGTKPTVEGDFTGVETYFFDCNEDLYGEVLKTELLHFARPEQKFPSVADLRERIALDEQGALRYFKEDAKRFKDRV